MTFRVRVNGIESNLEIQQEGEFCRFRYGAEQERLASVRDVEPNVYSIILDGRTYEAKVEGDTVNVSGHRFSVDIIDPRRWTRKSAGEGREGRAEISALMPGKVVRLLVEPGDLVAAGQGMVVVEAMKMQNEIKAPKAGRVASLAVREGASVNAGEILATIE